MDMIDQLLQVALRPWHSQHGTLHVRFSVKVCIQRIMICSRPLCTREAVGLSMAYQGKRRARSLPVGFDVSNTGLRGSLAVGHATDPLTVNLANGFGAGCPSCRGTFRA